MGNFTSSSSILPFFEILYGPSKLREEHRYAIFLTSAAPLEIDFPLAGKKWQRYKKREFNLKTKKSSLLSSLYVKGAHAENFCGLYDQSDILRRIFSGAKQQGLEFSIINPFE